MRTVRFGIKLSMGFHVAEMISPRVKKGNILRAVWWAEGVDWNHETVR